MAIAVQDVDLNEVDFETVDTGGMPEPGRYHVRLIDVEEEDDGDHTPCDKLTFLVLAGNPPHQQGKKVTERIYHVGSDDHKTKNAIKRALAIAKRMGIYTDADLQAGISIDYAAGINREYVIDLKEDSYMDAKGQNRKSVRMEYVGIYPMGDPRVADCPLAGKPAPGGLRPQQQQPQQRQDAAKKPPTQQKMQPRATQQMAADLNEV